MKKSLFTLLVLTYSIVLGAQSSERFLVHPKWELQDTVRIKAFIDLITTEGSDTTRNQSTTDQWFVVTTVEKQYYVVDWVSGEFELPIIPGLEEVSQMIDTALRQIDFPMVQIEIDKWGYANSIRNIEDVKRPFSTYLDALVQLAEEQYEVDDALLSQAKSQLLDEKALEQRLLTSIQFMFLPYDYWIPTSQEIVDSGYVAVPFFDDPIPQLARTTRTNTSDPNTIEVTTNSRYIIAEDLLPIEIEGQQISNFATSEIVSFSLDLDSTRINWVKITSEQVFGEVSVKTQVRYEYD